IQPSTRGIDPERRVSHPIGISHMNMNTPAVFQVAALRSYSVRASLAAGAPPQTENQIKKTPPPVFQVAAWRSYSVRASLADVGPPRRATWSAVAENAVAMTTTTQFTSPNAVIDAAPTGSTRRKTRKNPTAARAWVSTVT